MPPRRVAAEAKAAHVAPVPTPAPAPPAPAFRGLEFAHPPPAHLTAQVEAWLAELNPKDLELQRLAASFLKTSYFPEKTHGFKKWAAKRNNA